MTSNAFEKITASKFKKELEQGDKILLDVRTPGEAKMFGKIEGEQTLIDIYSSDAGEKILKLNTSKKYLIYCHSGNRSTTVRNYMQQNNFTYAKDLEGGIDAWNLLK